MSAHDAGALREAGRLPDALRLANAALHAGGNATALLLERAMTLEAWGRHRESRRDVERAAAAGVEDARLMRALAALAHRSGRYPDAERLLRRAIENDPSDLQARIALAHVEQAAGALDRAARSWREIAAGDPGEVRHALALANVELRRGDRDAALAIASELVARHPERWEGHAALGMVLADAGRLDEGVDAYAAAGRLADAIGDPAEVFVDHAIALCAAGRAREGADILLARLPASPNLRGHRQLATALLSIGRYDPGWKQLDYRWFDGPQAALRADHPFPAWKGQDLRGRTILLRAEQGIGDTLQFIRYAPRVRSLGARVMFLPLSGMEAFSKRFDGVDIVVSDEATIREADFYADLMSLPRVFGTVEGTVPGVAPLRPDAGPAPAKWSSRLPRCDRPTVGLVWAGRSDHTRDRFRSIALERLRPLLDVANIRWVSLQKGPSVRQAEIVPESVDWQGIGPELDSLDDAAAVVARLDLVVSVDTALAHLAATLGKPVWMLVAEPADCRWLEAREDTPWYPSMRLFRQSRVDEWQPVVERVRAELAAWAGAWRAADPSMRPAPPGALARRAAPSPVDGPAPPLAEVIDTRAGLVQHRPESDDIGHSIASYGEYLEPRLAVLLRMVPRGAVWIEACAGVGIHTLSLARAVGPEGELLAWESRAFERRLLVHNLAANRIANVTTMWRTLGGPPSGERTEGRESIDELQLERLDGVYANDGADAAAIVDGAHETLWRCRPSLMLAVADDAALGALAARVRELGYRTWRMETPMFSPSNFNRREDDIFGGRAALALVALPEEIDLREAPPGCVELQ